MEKKRAPQQLADDSEIYLSGGQHHHTIVKMKDFRLLAKQGNGFYMPCEYQVLESKKKKVRYPWFEWTAVGNFFVSPYDRKEQQVLSEKSFIDDEGHMVNPEASDK